MMSLSLAFECGHRCVWLIDGMHTSWRNALMTGKAMSVVSTRWVAFGTLWHWRPEGSCTCIDFGWPWSHRGRRSCLPGRSSPPSCRNRFDSTGEALASDWIKLFPPALKKMLHYAHWDNLINAGNQVTHLFQTAGRAARSVRRHPVSRRCLDCHCISKNDLSEPSES